MKLVWFKNVPEEHKAQFAQELKASVALKKLMEILRDKAETMTRKGFREEDYDTSDWVFKQAFNNGRLAELQEIVDLINFKEN